MPETVRVAAIQATPVFLDREATVDRTVALVAEAAAAGARLMLFPEAFVPGYPDWVWRTRPWGDGSVQLFERLVDQAVTVPGPAVDRLADAAAAANAYVVVGVNERSSTGGTLYNSLLYLGPAGDVLGVHRKLMPTGGERLVWGAGDGSSLVTFDTEVGRVGGLICWESYMPLARAALYGQGLDIYLAPTWDNSDTWVSSMRHVAKEGRCFVVSTNSFLRGSDVPAAELGVEDLYGGDDDWMSRGNACIVGPEGDLLAGPLIEQAGILYADLELGAVTRARLQFDAPGHYSRSDVLSLVVDSSAKPAIRFRGGAGEAQAAPDSSSGSTGSDTPHGSRSTSHDNDRMRSPSVSIQSTSSTPAASQ